MIELERVSKRYQMGGEVVTALDEVCLTIDDHEYVAIIGPSGSGKSTLMNIVGCLDTADSGAYRLDGQDITRYTARQLAFIRNRKVGFIFQQFNLLQKLTAYENVELPLIYQGIGLGDRRARVAEALRSVGLADRMRHRPNQLSGGQQQRVAVARALVTHPSLILADEPTGNLDSRTSLEIMDMLRQLHEAGNSIVLITHDPNIAAQAPRRVRIADGRLTEAAATPQEVDRV
jgi:putative ABC transport system ATP-binding protein